MKNFACRYAIVQFLPYSETGEFANAGVVLACPKTGFFDFKLQIRKYGRVTAFFDELDHNVYRTALKMMEGELVRIQNVAKAMPDTAERADQIRNLFTALTHPREAIVRFGPARPILTDDPATELLRQFDHYVDRSFAKQEYIEQTITKHLQQLLSGLTLPAPFKEERIGDDQIHANFPLVQKRDDQVSKIIKPFNLAQSEPNSIFDHGDVWLQKIRRMRKRDLLPQDVLFAVAAPPEAEIKRFDAYREICTELQHQDVIVVEESAEAKIAEFASA